MKRIIFIVTALLISCQQGAPQQGTPDQRTETAPTPSTSVPKSQPTPQPEIPARRKTSAVDLISVIDTSTSIDGLIEKALSNHIGKPASFTVRSSGTHFDLQLICGKPVSPDGKWLDYSDTRYNQAILDGAFEDSFCALTHKNGKQYDLLEFDFGSTDAPVFDWLERYGLPLSVLKSKP